MKQKLALNFDILSDRHNDVASQFDLTFALPEELKGMYRNFGIDLAQFNGDNSWTLPMPGRFILDPQATIRSAEADPDYTIRPEPDDTVKTLRELTGLSQSA
jgi:peroxiredoxin